MTSVHPWLLGLVVLLGCDGSEPRPRPAPPDAGIRTGANPAPAAPGGAAVDVLPERPEKHLGAVSLRGTVLDVRVFGELEPEARVRVDLLYASGARPGDLRVWVGPEDAAAGAAPAAEVPDAPKLYRAVLTLGTAVGERDRLWMEFTAPGGNPARGSFALR